MAFALSGCLKGCEDKKPIPEKTEQNPDKPNLETPAEKTSEMENPEKPNLETPAEKPSEVEAPDTPKEELPDEPGSPPPVEEKKE